MLTGIVSFDLNVLFLRSVPVITQYMNPILRAILNSYLKKSIMRTISFMTTDFTINKQNDSYY